MRVPSALFSYLGKSEIVKSLGTSHLAHARKLARNLVYQTEKVLTLIQSNMLSEEQIIKLINRYKEEFLSNSRRCENYTDVVRAFEQGILPRQLDPNDFDHYLPARSTTRTSNEISSLISAYQKQIKYLRTQLPLLSFDDNIRAKTRLLAEQNGHSSIVPPEAYFDPNQREYDEPPNDDFYCLTKELIRAHIQIYEIEIERLKGNETSYDRSIREQSLKPYRTLSEVLELKLESKKREGLRLKSLAKIEHANNFILYLFGDNDMRSYSPERLSEIDKILRKWPNKAHRLGEHLKYLRPEEVIKRQDLGLTISGQTLNFFLAEIKNTFEYAVKHGWIDRSPCFDWKIKANKTKQVNGDIDHSEPWSDDELKQLFESKYLASRANKYKNCENYWLPILALYSGARQNELCQLYCDDIKKDDSGIWYFTFAHNEGRRQSIKNKTTRDVPIHHKLIDLELLNYLDFISQKHERLFPNLEFDEKQGNFSNNFSKRFGKMAKRTFIWDTKNKVFHGLRSTFVKTLRDENRLDEQHIAYLTGHAPQNKMVRYYGGKIDVKYLNDFIQKLTYKEEIVNSLTLWKL